MWPSSVPIKYRESSSGLKAIVLTPSFMAVSSCLMLVSVLLKSTQRKSECQSVVLTMVQFVTLPSPEQLKKLRYPSRLSFAHFT